MKSLHVWSIWANEKSQVHVVFPPPGANAVGSAVTATTIATSAAHVPAPDVCGKVLSSVPFDISLCPKLFSPPLFNSPNEFQTTTTSTSKDHTSPIISILLMEEFPTNLLNLVAYHLIPLFTTGFIHAKVVVWDFWTHQPYPPKTQIPSPPDSSYQRAIPFAARHSRTVAGVPRACHCARVARHVSPEGGQWCEVVKDLLVGGWTNPSERYARQIGSFPQV